MLTRTGWLVVLGAIPAFIAGRTFGLVELYAVGGALLAVATLASVLVMTTRLRIEVGRRIAQRRVHAGTPARVDLTIRNDGGRRTPVLRLHDPVSGTQGASLLLTSLLPDETTSPAYRLPTERRGIISVGPLTVAVTDPFGIASLRTEAAPLTELTVLPHVDDIAPPPPSAGDEPLSGVRSTRVAASAGDDFAALRQYVVGDDLRRVHWPSSARHDELLVRQDEVHWQGRTTIVLDTRTHTWSPEPFELAVSAAASIVAASWRRRDLVRLLTTTGWDSGIAEGQSHVERMLEFLAAVQPHPEGSLMNLSQGLLGATGGAALVAVVGGIDDREVAALGALRGGSSSLMVVQVDVAPWRANAEPLPASDHPDLVRVTPQHPFAPTWNAAVARQRAGRGARRHARTQAVN